MSDLIERQAAIDALAEHEKSNGHNYTLFVDIVSECAEIIRDLPAAQPEIIRCKDCKYWHNGSCEYPEHVVYCQDYMVGDIETEAEHFCGYAERREVNNESN